MKKYPQRTLKLVQIRIQSLVSDGSPVIIEVGVAQAHEANIWAAQTRLQCVYLLCLLIFLPPAVKLHWDLWNLLLKVTLRT
jgi:hypothetical protein